MTTAVSVLCPFCFSGHLVPKVVDYTTTDSDGQKIVVPDVEIKICDKCGESTISIDSSRKVEAYVAEEIELLSPTELKAIRELLDVDQGEMSEILGLGSKTYHRWENGNQIPSRSMGYYLRVLNEFPDAFSWLRVRKWRYQNKVIKVDFKAAFPNLMESPEVYVMQPQEKNPAKILFGGKTR